MDKKTGGVKPPSATSKNKDEKRLGKALDSIRQLLIKPYKNLKTEEEREKFRNDHPEIDEVMQIVSEIDENNIPQNLINARAINEWVEKSEGAKLPSGIAKDEAEKRLGRALSMIRNRLIKPYMLLETEEEREIFREKHNETDEVLDIISGLDIQCGNEKQRELAILIREDIEKRRKLQEAKKLEQEYEKQLSIKRGTASKDIQEQGVDFDGQ